MVVTDHDEFVNQGRIILGEKWNGAMPLEEALRHLDDFKESHPVLSESSNGNNNH